MSFKLGLTGAPGAGKSMAAAFLSGMGWRVLDADTVCHALLDEPGGAIAAAVAGRWGAAAIDEAGRPRRKAIAEIVFGDPLERVWLESLMHPVARERVRRWLEEAGGRPSVVEAPLLFEAGWELLFDAVAAVWAPESACLRRLRAKGWTDAQAASRRSAQAPAAVKLEKARHGLVNTGSPDYLRRQCVALNTILLKQGRF